MVNENLVRVLVEKKVLRFGSFTLKSGRESPYFFNSGNLDSGKALSAVAEAFADDIVRKKIDFDVILGPAYKGIPLGAALVKTLYEKYGIEKRFVFDRKEIKDYGDSKGKMIVGNLKEGDKILMIDDVTTTGLTKFETIEKLNTIGIKLNFVGLIIIFDRQERGDSGRSAVQEIEEKGLKVYSLLKARETFDYLVGKEINNEVYVKKEIYKNFNEYFNNYGIKD